MLRRLLTATAVLCLFLSSTSLALAEENPSPSSFPAGSNTILWSGQGTSNGDVTSVQCSGDTSVPGTLLWIFTTDGAALGSPDPVLVINGTVSYSGTNKGGSWHFVTPWYDPDPTVTDAHVDFQVATAGSGSLVLTISHGCPPEEEAAISAITTEVHDALHQDITGTSVPLGSIVHDSATLSWDPDDAVVPGSSSVTFYFFAGDAPNDEGSCAADLGEALASQTFDVETSGPWASPEGFEDALIQGPLAAGSYYYFAEFHSGDTHVMTHATSGCEPFSVDKDTTTTVTEIHRGATDSGAPIVVPIGGDVPVGSTVHDSASVTADNFASDTIFPTGYVQFAFFTNATCDPGELDENLADAGLVELVDGVADPSDAFGPLAMGSYSFQAAYLGDDNYEGSISDCEPFGAFNQPLTPGYWKNHLAPIGSTITAFATNCRSNQGCSANGPWTYDLLPQSLGNFTIPKTGAGLNFVVAVFNKMNCSNSGNTATQNNNAIGCLAGHLLAAKLNVANLSNPCIQDTIHKADAFLKGQTVDGVTGVTYTGPTGNYSSITSAQRAMAIELKSILDTYNNGGGCP